MNAKKTFAWSLEENAHGYALWVELPAREAVCGVRGRQLVVTCGAQSCTFVLPDDADAEHARAESSPGQLRLTFPRYQKSA